MKYRIFFPIILLFITFTFNSCESLTGCRVCRQVTYVNDKIEQEGNESEYCGAELVAIEAADDIVTGNTRVTWECR